MEYRDFMIGFLTATALFVTLNVKGLENGWRSIHWRSILKDIFQRMTKKGILLSLLIPGIWLVVWFSLAIHLRTGLGHWPTALGQNPGSELFDWHLKFSYALARFLMVFYLYILPIIFIAGLIVKKWRHLSIYMAINGFAQFAVWAICMVTPNSSFTSWWYT